MLLRIIFGPSRDEKEGSGENYIMRSFMIFTLHQIYSDDGIERNEMVGHVARMGKIRSAYSDLVGEPEGKRPLGGLRRRWKDNIKMDVNEVGWRGMDWIDLAQDRDR